VSGNGDEKYARPALPRCHPYSPLQIKEEKKGKMTTTYAYYWVISIPSPSPFSTQNIPIHFSMAFTGLECVGYNIPLCMELGQE